MESDTAGRFRPVAADTYDRRYLPLSQGDTKSCGGCDALLRARQSGRLAAGIELPVKYDFGVKSVLLLFTPH